MYVVITDNGHLGHGHRPKWGKLVIINLTVFVQCQNRWLSTILTIQNCWRLNVCECECLMNCAHDNDLPASGPHKPLGFLYLFTRTIQTYTDTHRHTGKESILAVFPYPSGCTVILLSTFPWCDKWNDNAPTQYGNFVCFLCNQMHLEMMYDVHGVGLLSRATIRSAHPLCSETYLLHMNVWIVSQWTHHFSSH